MLFRSHVTYIEDLIVDIIDLLQLPVVVGTTTASFETYTFKNYMYKFKSIRSTEIPISIYIRIFEFLDFLDLRVFREFTDKWKSIYSSTSAN